MKRFGGIMQGSLQQINTVCYLCVCHSKSFGNTTYGVYFCNVLLLIY